MCLFKRILALLIMGFTIYIHVKLYNSFECKIYGWMVIVYIAVTSPFKPLNKPSPGKDWAE